MLKLKELLLFLLLLFIFWIPGSYIGMLISEYTYCLIYTNVCNRSYGDGYIIYFGLIGVTLLCTTFYYTRNYFRKHL